jgi:hypothetical protein
LSEGSAQAGRESGAPPHGIAPVHAQGQFKRILKRTLAFLVIGPPLGLATYTIGGFAIGELELTRPDEISTAKLVAILFMMVVIAVPSVYLVALLPAVLVGLALAWLHVRYRSFGVPHVTLIALALGLVFASVFDTSGDVRDWHWWAYAAVKIATCVVPVLVWWSLVPASEVRDTSRHVLTRTSEAKGH